MPVKLWKSRIEAAKDKGQFMKKVEVKMCSFLPIIKTPMDFDKARYKSHWQSPRSASAVISDTNILIYKHYTSIYRYPVLDISVSPSANDWQFSTRVDNSSEKKQAFWS